MKKLSVNELKQIEGGINITASLLTSIVRGINSLLDLGVDKERINYELFS